MDDQTQLEHRLIAERPFPSPAFRGELRRMIERSGMRAPRALWLRIALSGAGGLACFGLAGLGVAGAGPLG